MSNFDDLLYNKPEGEKNTNYTKEDYAAKKKAEREEIYSLSDVIAMEIAEDYDSFVQYLDIQSRFDRYSAVNTILIMAQNPDAMQLGDFDYWKNQNCNVKEGEKGISILEPYEYKKNDGSAGTGYNVKKVFDIAQMGTENMKESATPQYTERQLLSALISGAPVKISSSDSISADAGAKTDDEASEVIVCKGMGFDNTFMSIARELAFVETVSNAHDVAVPEYTAVCASYVLCKKYGVDMQIFNELPNAFDIIEDLNPQIVKHELSKIRNAVSVISGRMAKQLEPKDKPAKNNEAR
jgi:hypothetical protein